MERIAKTMRLPAFDLVLVLVLLLVGDAWSEEELNAENVVNFAARVKTDIKRNGTDDLPSSTSKPPMQLKLSVRLEPQVYIPGGRLAIGGHAHHHSQSPTDSASAASYNPAETAPRIVDVKPFRMDRHPVTNGDFMYFSRAKTQYRTDAERDGRSWVLKSHVSAKMPTYDDRVTSHADGAHWKAVRSASWHQPYGPGSNIAGREKDPVVHVSYRDAFAFCSWVNKRLPTEEEWEFAARAGANGTEYPWGNEFSPNRSNTWQGTFPTYNQLVDGYHGISPVGAFPMQNSYGMFDMVGNVWEWTATVYEVKFKPRDRNRSPYTLKGGSFIDSQNKVTTSYRMGQLTDYAAENVGFRCVKSVAAGDTQRKPAVRHRLQETWGYKVKRAITAIVGAVRKGTHVAEEL